MDNDIEMVESARNEVSGGTGRAYNKHLKEGRRVNLIGADDIVVTRSNFQHDDELEDGYPLDPVMHRQNTCFFVALVGFLIAMSVMLVGKVYMAPAEVDNVVGQIHVVEGGDVEIVNAPAADGSSGSGSGQEPPKGGSSGGLVTTNVAQQNPYAHGRDKTFDVSTWLHDKGRVPPQGPMKDRDRPGGVFGIGGGLGGGGDGNGGGGRFDMKKWTSAKVALSDGKMYEVVKQLNHDPKAFTEGLAFARGELYESTGINGQSSIRKLDPDTGDVLESIPLEDKYFGEGLSLVHGKAIQLTWQSRVGFIYDVSDLSKEPQNFTFTSTRNEGWGLAYSPYFNELAMSDGSDYIHFWNARNMSETRRIKVKRQNGADSRQINELEFFHGRLLANIWYEDVIISINPITGEVDKEYGTCSDPVVVSLLLFIFCSLYVCSSTYRSRFTSNTVDSSLA
jgi:glutamine cyclotransferase